MARPNLTITLAVNDACTDLTLTDATGTYPTQSAGYGLPSGPTLNNITGLVVVLTYGNGSYLTFTFTIVNQVITACTLGISGGTPISILSQLASTTWPLTNFSFFRNYGVTVPSFGDMVYTADYTISGTVMGVAFNYTTSLSIVRRCDLCCCLAKSFQKVDPECITEDELFKKVMADTYSKVSVFCANVGNTDRAQLVLTKATDLCQCNCGCND